MARKLHDQYFKKAKQEGYFARSVYKLEQINQKFHILKAGDTVLDLGSTPGSWLQYILKVVGETGRAVGVDIQPVKPSLRKKALVLLKDIAEVRPEDFEQLENFKGFDAVVSDMAPRTSGVRWVDQAESLELVSLAFALARTVLKPSGHFVAKIFESPEVQELTAEIRPLFAEVCFFKPPAARKESFETYLMARGYGVSSEKFSLKKNKPSRKTGRKGGQY